MLLIYSLRQIFHLDTLTQPIHSTLMTSRQARAIRRSLGLPRLPKDCAPYQRRYYRSVKQRFNATPGAQRASYLAREAASHRETISALEAAVLSQPSTSS